MLATLGKMRSKMGVYTDREAYREAIYNDPYSPQTMRIAHELDRLAGLSADRGQMFEMQVASVLYAAKSAGYVLRRHDGPAALLGLDKP
jgi:hypothetical protein